MALHGSNTVVKIGGEDLTSFTDSTEFNDDSDMAETTTYGRKRKAYIGGMEDGTVTLGGVYDVGVDGPAAILTPLKRSREVTEFIIQPAGTGAGLPQRAVDVIVKKFVTSHPVADKVTWSAELQMVGDNIVDTVQV